MFKVGITPEIGNYIGNKQLLSIITNYQLSIITNSQLADGFPVQVHLYCNNLKKRLYE